MRLWVFHCFLSSLVLDFAGADVSGVCITKHTVTKRRYAMDKSNRTWLFQEYQVPVEVEECCDGYRMKSRVPLVCSPTCEPACENSDCMAPNTCVCHLGHQLVNNSTTTCYDVCDSCVNGECLYDELECTCYTGYTRDNTSPHICNPVCSPVCLNAVCAQPQKCECFEGFQVLRLFDRICVPVCSNGCAFGRCTSPEVCTCFEGYMIDRSSPSNCLPVCNHTCENGFCVAPNSCECNEGFELHPRNPFQCVPQVPENTSLNFCSLKMHKAVLFDKDTDCFLIKDKVTVSGDANCQPLAAISQPKCLQPNSCDSFECSLKFRCSAKRVNNTNEIHCFLERDDYQTEERRNLLILGTGWTDVTLVVNAIQYNNFSYVKMKQNDIREWSLNPLSKLPVCAQMHFGVEICGSMPLTEVSHLNTSVMTVMNLILIIGFLLLVGVGVGGFLWTRHRILRDPLNYREDMTRGYHNECYEGRPTELVSDDEIELDSDKTS